MQGGLADFELGGELGEGGTATVVRAIHRPTGTAVAIKSALMRSAPVRRALERELSAMARLHHPAILHLFDHGVAEAGDVLPEGHAWMALELASGGSLARLPPRNWPDVLNMTRTVLEGLAHAHARGLIHRDLKPSNLMRCVAADLRPGLKLADFGLAWAWQEGDDEVPRAGTPLYMAPEQILGEGEEFGPWTDLYALGAIVWRWITGAPPYGWTRSPQQALRGHLRGTLPKMAPFLEDVPDGIEALLQALLQKEPMDRPQSAAEVLHWLDQIPSRPAGPPPIPVSWRGAERAGNSHLLHGAGLALFGLRDLDVAGRVAERNLLWDGFRRAAESKRSGAVLITGAPGAGASRLGRWLCERAMELTGVQVHRAVPEEGGITGLAGRALALSLIPEEDVGHDIVRARLEMDLEADRVRPVSVFRWLRREAEHTPQLVWLDDVHRDEAALELLATLVYRNPERPIFVVATAGEADEAVDEVSNAEGLHRISLQPLELRETMELVTDRLGLAQDLAAQVARRAHGVPGLAVDWVRSWMDAGVLIPSADGFRRAPHAPEMDTGLTPSADDARTQRFESVMSELGENGRANVLAGALLGRSVLLEEWLRLTAALGLNRREPTLRRLVRSGVASRSKKGWDFTDPGHRALALQRLRDSGQWEDWHDTAAKVLARRTRTPDRDLRRADLMLESGQIEGAQILLRAAIDPLIEGSQWRLLAWVAGRLRDCGDLDNPDPMVRFRVLQATVVSVANAQSPRDAVDRAVMLAELAGDLPHKYARLALRLAGQVLTFANECRRARTYLERLPQDDPEVIRTLGVGALRLGELVRAETLLSSLLGRSPLFTAIAHHELGNLALARDDLDAAHTHFLEAAQGFRSEEGSRAFVANVGRTHVLIRRGEMRAAAELATTALDEALDCGSLHETSNTALVLCIVSLALGDAEAVERTWPLALLRTMASVDYPSLLACMERAYESTSDPISREKLITLARHVLIGQEEETWTARVNEWAHR